MDAKEGSEEIKELEVLSILLDDYEKRHYDIPLPSPLEAIKFRVEQMGLSQDDVVPYFGSKSKVPEILSGKRELSTQMIHRLHKYFNIPLDVLLQAGKIEDDTLGIKVRRNMAHVKQSKSKKKST